MSTKIAPTRGILPSCQYRTTAAAPRSNIPSTQDNRQLAASTSRLLALGQAAVRDTGVKCGRSRTSGSPSVGREDGTPLNSGRRQVLFDDGSLWRDTQHAVMAHMMVVPSDSAYVARRHLADWRSCLMGLSQMNLEAVQSGPGGMEAQCHETYD